MLHFLFVLATTASVVLGLFSFAAFVSYFLLPRGKQDEYAKAAWVSLLILIVALSWVLFAARIF